MLLSLERDQELFRETTAKLLNQLAAPAAVRALRDHPNGFAAEYWRRGADLGWTSLLVSEAHGGGSISSRGLVDLALVAYEFGRHAAPGPLGVVNVVAATLSESG
jgi:alkylation response protein AidB-like acyl-CoA dehydrogenase